MQRALFIAIILCALGLAPAAAMADDDAERLAPVDTVQADEDDTGGGSWGGGSDDDDAADDDAADDDATDDDAADDDATDDDTGSGSWGGGSDDDDAADDDAAGDDAAGDDAADDDDDATDPPAIKREGKDAREARKAAMGALSEKHPPSADGGGFTPIVASPPPIVREPVEPLPRLEHHGYLRARLDLFYNMDLDTKGTSPVPPPLDSAERGADTQLTVEPTDSETLAGGNMRFRYAPVLQITEELRIHAMLDLLDNYVLGTAPDGLHGARTDVPILGLTESTEDPTFETLGRDALSVRALYGEAETLIGIIRVGRIPVHWGLGILHNDGGTHDKIRTLLGEDAWSCIDCDYGDYLDRIELETRIPFVDFFYVKFSWDFIWEGLASYDAARPMGQAVDLAQADDVIQFTISLFDEPVDKETANAWLRAFNKNEPVFKWGAYFVYRSQDADIENLPTADTQDGAQTFDQLQIRGLTLYTPDLWGELAWKLDANMHLKLAAEVVARIGELDQVSADDTENREFLQFGGAFESELRLWDGYIGLNAGFATGKETPGFGYEDVSDLGNADLLQATLDVNNYRFDRNYIIDMIMFRELIGGVTNAVYFDLWGKYEFPTGPSDSPNILGARLDLLTSVAIDAEATPGDANWYGFESDLSLYYKETNRFLVELAGGVFVPGSAWDRIAGRPYPILPDPGIYPDHVSIEDDITASVPFTIQTNFYWMF